MSTPTTINPPASTARDSWSRRFFTMENRFIPPIFITAILLMGHFSFGILES